MTRPRIRIQIANDWRVPGYGVRWFSLHTTCGRWWTFSHIAVAGFALQVETPRSWWAAQERLERKADVEELIASVERRAA